MDLFIFDETTIHQSLEDLDQRDTVFGYHDSNDCDSALGYVWLGDIISKNAR